VGSGVCARDICECRRGYPTEHARYETAPLDFG